MSIQALNKTHLDAMIAIEVAANQFPWSYKNMESCFGGRYFNFGFFIADELAGFYIGEIAGPDITLMDICVDHKLQGQGVGAKLMTHLLAQAEAKGAESIFLEVRASNKAAIHLYNKMGFCEMGIRKNYYPTAEGNEDAVLMGLPFNPFAKHM